MDKDCADWSGLTLTDVRKGLQVTREAHPDALAETEVDGVVHYYGAEGPHGGAGPDAAAGIGPRIDLIQCYDEYVMGYSVTRHYMGGGAPAFPFRGEPMHVVLLDGRQAGSWRHTLFPGRCELDIRIARPAAPGSPLAAAVQAAADRYEAFLELPTVRVGPGA
jgi:hypothetical protein